MRGIRAGGVHIRVRGCQDPLLRDLQHLLRCAGRGSGRYSLLLRDVDLWAYLRHCLTVQLSPCSVTILSGLLRWLPLPLGLRLGKRDLSLRWCLLACEKCSCSDVHEVGLVSHFPCVGASVVVVEFPLPCAA